VASGKGSVTVSPEHYFRALSGSGSQIGGIEKGGWRVEPANGGVRVIPPAGRESLAVKKAVLDPPGATAPVPPLASSRGSTGRRAITSPAGPPSPT